MLIRECDRCKTQDVTEFVEERIFEKHNKQMDLCEKCFERIKNDIDSIEKKHDEKLNKLLEELGI